MIQSCDKIIFWLIDYNDGLIVISGLARAHLSLSMPVASERERGSVCKCDSHFHLLQKKEENDKDVRLRPKTIIWSIPKQQTPWLAQTQTWSEGKQHNMT